MDAFSVPDPMRSWSDRDDAEQLGIDDQTLLRRSLRADFKGEFRLGDGQCCCPLNVTDQASSACCSTRQSPPLEVVSHVSGTIRYLSLKVGHIDSGGWGGIRTHGTLARTAVFKTAALNHSATHPRDGRSGGREDKIERISVVEKQPLM
jgi:hypothetical protein